MKITDYFLVEEDERPEREKLRKKKKKTINNSFYCLYIQTIL
jgi:hypothetical protein